MILFTKQNIIKIFWVLLFIVIIGFSYKIISPFITPILFSILVTYISYPLYLKLNKKIKPIFSRIIILIVVSVLLFGPLGYIGYQLTTDTIKIYNNFNLDGVISGCETNSTSFLCNIPTYFENSVFGKLGMDLGENIETTIKQGLSFLYTFLTKILYNIPAFLFQYGIFIFVTYFFLKDGKRFIEEILKILPFKKRLYNQFFKIFDRMISAIIYGTFLSALIQGIIAYILYVIIGLPSAFFFAFLLSIFALIPFLGAIMGWAPIALYFIMKGIILSSSVFIIKGIVVAIVGFVIISQLDNILKPLIVGGKGQVHTLIIFFGIIGGIIAFGPVGLFYGPIILSFAELLIKTMSGELGY